MQGIRVVPIFRQPDECLTEADRAIRPDRRLRAVEGSEFARNFGCVLPDLGHLVWLAGEDAFRFPPDWGDDRYEKVDRRRTWIAQQGDRRSGSVDPNWILESGFVASYARYVDDDWNWLYGFAPAPDDWRGWMRRRFEGDPGERAAFLAATVEACFFSIDFRYWEFFARDGRLVDQARRGLGGLPGFRLEPARLAGSPGL